MLYQCLYKDVHEHVCLPESEGNSFPREGLEKPWKYGSLPYLCLLE